jgi:hypothetical protein
MGNKLIDGYLLVGPLEESQGIFAEDVQENRGLVYVCLKVL